jgi:hypothetical protein
MSKLTDTKPVCLEYDDLCDATRSKLIYVARLREKMPNVRVTLFAIPARCSRQTIDEARSLGDWVAIAPHGWRHGFAECMAWTSDETRAKLALARDMGIDAPAFRAPGWLLNDEVYAGCTSEGYVVADHASFRVLGSGASTYTYNKQLRNPPLLRLHGHLPNVSGNGIEEHFDEFIVTNHAAREFKFVHEVGEAPTPAVSEGIA